MIRPVIIHLHVPKCAGGSINRILERRFGARNLLPQHKDEALKGLSRTQRDARYDSVSGHNLWGLHKAFNRDVTYVSITRDPVSRLCSYFNFVHCSPRHRLHGDLRDLPDLSALSEEWLDAHPLVKRGWSNEACRTYFGGRFNPSRYAELERRVIDGILAGHFVVGPLPQIEAWLQTQRILDPDKTLPHDKRTVDLGRHGKRFVWAHPDTLSEQARGLLQSMSGLDSRLYEAIAWTNYVAGFWIRPTEGTDGLSFGLSGTSRPARRRHRPANASDRRAG